VPQSGQNERVACSDDLKCWGSPSTNRNDSGGTLNHATDGAPATWRHIVQWQIVSLVGWASIS
jgi:hypothetical protein